ncbi:MAG: hypothetical protein K0R94_1494 [Burkholderiales bacterium]|jgi:uncharacterized protein with PQ loop repeat|nr:hypothetical protein [Burkholderiales bacterium]
MNEKIVNKVGWFASILAITMYFSYIDQIVRNLSGIKGSVILPITTTLNCSAWVLYGALKKKRDWPIIACNIPGILLGIVTVFTALI